MERKKKKKIEKWVEYSSDDSSRMLLINLKHVNALTLSSDGKELGIVMNGKTTVLKYRDESMGIIQYSAIANSLKNFLDGGE